MEILFLFKIALAFAFVDFIVIGFGILVGFAVFANKLSRKPSYICINRFFKIIQFIVIGIHAIDQMLSGKKITPILVGKSILIVGKNQ